MKGVYPEYGLNNNGNHSLRSKGLTGDLITQRVEAKKAHGGKTNTNPQNTRKLYGALRRARSFLVFIIIR